MTHEHKTDKWTKRTEPDIRGQITESHPSYGTIGVSHTSGGAVLFQSDVSHQHFITITIREADRMIDGTREWVFGKRELIEVHLSAAQFAEFITTPNRGTGSPCTIHFVAGDQPFEGVRFGRPAPPKPEPFLDKFKGTGRQYLDKMMGRIQECRALVDAMLSGDAKMNKTEVGKLSSHLGLAIQDLRSDLPFVIDQLDEQTEERMQKAVTEFDSYVGMRLQEMGLEAMKMQTPRLSSGTEEIKALPEGNE